MVRLRPPVPVSKGSEVSAPASAGWLVVVAVVEEEGMASLGGYGGASCPSIGALVLGRLGVASLEEWAGLPAGVEGTLWPLPRLMRPLRLCTSGGP